MRAARNALIAIMTLFFAQMGYSESVTIKEPDLKYIERVHVVRTTSRSKVTKAESKKISKKAKKKIKSKKRKK